VDSVDVVVIGGGVIGLSCAVALARTGREVVVIERLPGIGMGTTSRNSEVVHGGMYYPTGSLKQRLCIEGRRKLYPYMEAHGVAHRRCGKLIVATTPHEVGSIEAIYDQGSRNGVEELALLSGAKASAMEGALSCIAALWSPQTGILDCHALMIALRGELESNGGVIALGTPVEAVESAKGGGFLVYTGGETPFALTATALVNCAGLHAQSVAARIEELDPSHIPALVLAKGSYFSCSAKPVFSRLIYPAPVKGGLGVHATLDLAGRMRFGPDVEWLDHANPDVLDYAVDPARGDGFYEAVRRYWPGLPDGALQPDYAGFRPKLADCGEAAADFRIDGADVHDVSGLVNVFGIESPGITSALAIAEEIVARLR
jgi:L-2-hydroxyglutarate oxidase LhgO